MSDVSLLFSGKLTPAQFIAKEWANALHLVDALPAEIQPLGKDLITDAEAAVTAAEGWTGTAIAAFLSANSSGLETEILNLLSGLGASTGPFKAASQDVMTATLKLLLALVAHVVMSFQTANAPSAPPAAE